MRLGYGLLVGFAVLSGGCTTVPTIVAISGSDTVPLNTRMEVHEALGSPTIRSTSNDGTPFEEFQIRGECYQTVWGIRVPAFQLLEEFHIHGWGDLQMIEANNVRDLPTTAKNQIVVATIKNVLHFRIFDEDGNIVVDTNETKLTLATQASLLADLKRQLESEWPPHKLTKTEKDRVIATVASIVGHNPLGSFELCVESRGLKNMLTKNISIPDEKDRHRVIPGQKLRFDYDKRDRVTNVYLNGEFLLSPTTIPDNPQQ